MARVETQWHSEESESLITFYFYPASFSYRALREIVRYQIFCGSGGERSIKLLRKDKGQTGIPKPSCIPHTTLLQARHFNGSDRKKFLDHVASEMQKTELVLIMGHFPRHVFEFEDPQNYRIVGNEIPNVIRDFVTSLKTDFFNDDSRAG